MQIARRTTCAGPRMGRVWPRVKASRGALRVLDNFQSSGILGFMRLTFAHELIWNMLETGGFGESSACPSVDRSGRGARGNGIT